jgi:hypothetical protein
MGRLGLASSAEADSGRPGVYVLGPVLASFGLFGLDALWSNSRVMRKILAVLAFAAVMAAQSTPPETAKPSVATPVAFRFERVSMDSLTFIKDCYRVLPNGRYRRERSESPANPSGTPIPRGALDRFYVYDGQLNQAELAEIVSLINSPSVRSLREPEPLRTSFEFMDGIILRPSEPQQSFRLGSSEDYKRNQAAVKPILQWMKRMQARKGDQRKRASSDGCKLPDKVDFGLL